MYDLEKVIVPVIVYQDKFQLFAFEKRINLLFRRGILLYMNL